ncbi:hypothetical protein MTR67_027316 [Solanum verrucosum]|uniref:Uncharacterized protein n=1 Tax=Solanum verrucosum TaxID=315347 RepID=A0AAF0R231_SOLVR|nr:hypothetical protein MTR67_027316 [Solanum verrucosum]
MASLSLWCSCICVHRLQEFSVCVKSERAQLQTEEVVRITQGL